MHLQRGIEYYWSCCVFHGWGGLMLASSKLLSESLPTSENSLFCTTACICRVLSNKRSTDSAGHAGQCWLHYSIAGKRHSLGNSGPSPLCSIRGEQKKMIQFTVLHTRHVILFLCSTTFLWLAVLFWCLFFMGYLLACLRLVIPTSRTRICGHMFSEQGSAKHQKS